MDAINFATIIVALIAAASAYASSRATSKASNFNISTSSRVEMEKEAYDRARAYDTETIARQDREIEDLRTEHNACAAEIKQLRRSYEAEIELLRKRIARLEKGLQNNLEEILRERLREPDSGINDPTF